MATALVKLRTQIISAFADDRAWKANAAKLQRGLRAKFDRLVPGGIALPRRPWTVDVDTFVHHYIDDHIVDLLLLPTADLRFFLAQLAGNTSLTTVFASSGGDGVECYRDATTFLINADGAIGETVSWSRCISISKSNGANAYRKHLYEENYRGSEAKYGRGVVARNLETLVVRRGHGHFVNGRRIHLYGRFARDVGTTGKRAARVETRLLKVQLDKVRRPTASRLLKDRHTRRAGFAHRDHLFRAIVTARFASS